MDAGATRGIAWDIWINDPAVVTAPKPEPEQKPIVEMPIMEDDRFGTTLMDIQCIDRGGGSGYSSTSNTKSILKNTLSEKEQKKMEELVDSIMLDCIGRMLINKMPQNSITIQLSDINGGKFSVKNGEATVILGIAESHVLFHELFHAAQSLNKDEFSLNLEIEAWVAQYRFLQKSPDFVPGNRWYDMYEDSWLGRSVVRLNDHLNSKGMLKDTSEYDKFEEAIQNTVEWFQDSPTYHKSTFDSNKKGLDNFKNLIELSKDC